MKGPDNRVGPYAEIPIPDFPDSGKPKKHKSRHCRWRCFCCNCDGIRCLCAIFSILVVLVLFGFFFVPRVPIVDFYKAEPTEPMYFSGLTEVRGDWVAYVNVTADNWIVYKIRKIEIVVYDDNYPTTSIGTGTVTDYDLPIRNHTNAMIAPFTVHYTADGDLTGINIIQDFLTACVPNGSPIPLRLNVKVYLDWLTWFNYVPEFNTTQSVKCTS